uniref:Uncharacterized protein n=1 Tax=Globodera rostochiensis TaxID=31243 RepID=A0A914ICV5_GLORO
MHDKKLKNANALIELRYLGRGSGCAVGGEARYNGLGCEEGNLQPLIEVQRYNGLGCGEGKFEPLIKGMQFEPLIRPKIRPCTTVRGAGMAILNCLSQKNWAAQPKNVQQLTYAKHPNLKSSQQVLSDWGKKKRISLCATAVVTHNPLPGTQSSTVLKNPYFSQMHDKKLKNEVLYNAFCVLVQRFGVRRWQFELMIEPKKRRGTTVRGAGMAQVQRFGLRGWLFGKVDCARYNVLGDEVQRFGVRGWHRYNDSGCGDGYLEKLIVPGTTFWGLEMAV